MRPLLTVATLALLAGCTPANLRQEAGYDPNFGAATQEAAPYGALQNQPAAPLSAMPSAPAQSNQAIPSSDINSALFGSTAAPAGTATAPASPEPLSAIPAAPAVVASAPAVPTVETTAPAAGEDHAAISDSQDFKAVSSRETIETDKQRMEQNRAQYQQIQPTALPERTNDSKVSGVLAYAMNAPNKLGQSIYKRASVAADKSQAACLKYTTDEAAQEAFLKAGGPERDPKRLDPDGDGFACGFDPTPFQSGG